MAPFSYIIRTKRTPRKRRPQTPPSPASFFPPRSPSWQDETGRGHDQQLQQQQQCSSTNEQRPQCSGSRTNPSVHLPITNAASSVRYDTTATLVQDKDVARQFASFTLNESEKARPPVPYSNRAPRPTDYNLPVGCSLDLGRNSFVEMGNGDSSRSKESRRENEPHPPTRMRSATLPVTSLDHDLPPLPTSSNRRPPPAPIRIPRGHVMTPSVQLERIPEQSLQGSSNETYHRKASASTSFLPIIDVGTESLWKPVFRSGGLSPILSPGSSTDTGGASSSSGYPMTVKSLPTSLASSADGAKSGSSTGKGPATTTFNFPLPPPLPQLSRHLESRQQSSSTHLQAPSRPPRSTNPNAGTNDDDQAPPPPSSYLNITNMVSRALESSPSATTDRFSLQLQVEIPKSQSTPDTINAPSLSELMFSPSFAFPTDRGSLLYPHAVMRVDSATLPTDFPAFPSLPPSIRDAGSPLRGPYSDDPEDDNRPVSTLPPLSTYPARRRGDLPRSGLGLESVSPYQSSPDMDVSGSPSKSDLKAARRSVSILNMRHGDVMKAVSVAEVIREDGNLSSSSSAEVEGTIHVVSAPQPESFQRRGSQDSETSSSKSKRMRTSSGNGARVTNRDSSVTSIGGSIGKHFLKDSPIDEQGSFQFIPVNVGGGVQSEGRIGTRSRSKSSSSSTRGSPLNTTFAAHSGLRKLSVPNSTASSPSTSSMRSPIMPPASSTASSPRSAGPHSYSPQLYHAPIMDGSLSVAETPVGLRLRATSEAAATIGSRSSTLQGYRTRSGSSPGLGSQPSTPNATFPASATSPSFPMSVDSHDNFCELSLQLQNYTIPVAASEAAGSGHPRSAGSQDMSSPSNQVARKTSAGHLNVNSNSPSNASANLPRSRSFSRPPRPAPSPTGMPVSAINPTMTTTPSAPTTSTSSASASPSSRNLGLPQSKMSSGTLLAGKIGNMMRSRSASDAPPPMSIEGGSSAPRSAESGVWIQSAKSHTAHSSSISQNRKTDSSPGVTSTPVSIFESRSPSSFSAAVSRVLQTGLTRQRSKKSLREAEKDAQQQLTVEQEIIAPTPSAHVTPKVHVHLQSGRTEHREAPSNFPQSPRPYSTTSSGLDHSTQAVAVPDFHTEITVPKVEMPSKPQVTLSQAPQRRPGTAPLKISNQAPATISFYLPNSPNIQKVSSSPKFESIPVRWKGLTLDAAKWTFSSTQLQDIVGKAIRQSAESSSIRLLDPDVLDHEIPDETDRLEVLRDDIRAKYKYHVRKRKLLMRSLGFYIDGSDPETAARLMEELTELSEACDQLSEQLFQVTDQLSQISQMSQRHFSSALSMALRKLNTSLIRSKGEVIDLQLQVAMVEAERDEAWTTAEAIEKELEISAPRDVESGAQDGDRLKSPFAHATWSGSVRSKSPRSSKVSVSAARKTSIRASKASLRLSSSRRSARSSTSSIRFASVIAGPNSSSGYSSSPRPDSVPNVPPVPAIPGPRLALDPHYPSTFSHIASRRSSMIATPSSAARGMLQAQNQLFELLGIPIEDIDVPPSRPRSLSEPLSPLLPGLLKSDFKFALRRVSDPPPIFTLENSNNALVAKLSDDSVFH